MDESDGDGTHGCCNNRITVFCTKTYIGQSLFLRE